MARYLVNRLCPLTGVAHDRVLAYVPVSAIAHDTGYAPNFMEILGLKADDEFPIVQSPSGFVFAGWELSDDFVRKSESDALQHSTSVTDTIGYRRENLQMADAFLRTVERHFGSKSPLKLLDFGCGYGGLLRLLGSRDVIPHGYDTSPIQRVIAARSGATIFESPEEAVAAGPYDLIVFTEVLEHLANPRGGLRFLKSVASPGALLAITVPDIPQSYVDTTMARFKATGNLPLVFNPLVHMNHFSPESLRQILREEGITVLHDYGRTAGVMDAAAHFGDIPAPNPFMNAARIVKRARSTPQSTRLFCRFD